MKNLPLHNFSEPLVTTRPVYLFFLPWSLCHIGGVNQVVASLAAQMKAEGQFEPLVLTSDWDARVPVFEEVRGIRTVRWRIRSFARGMGIKASLSYRLWERSFRSTFASFCEEHNVAAVNVHFPNDTAFAIERLLAFNKKPLPLLLSFHGGDVTNISKLSEARKSDWRRLIGRAHATVHCSNDLAGRLNTVLQADLQCHTVYSGVDSHAFASQGFGEPPAGKRVILHVGKFDRNKGQDLLIDAFARVASQFPDVMLHLVGGSGPSLELLRAAAAAAGLADRIRFTIDVPPDEMPSHFRQAHYFVLPSRTEGFGLVLLEAGAFSLPVVATRVGGIPEIIEDACSGLLIEPNDASALTQALHKLLSEPNTARQLGEQLNRHVRDNFSWTKTRQQYEALVN